MSDIKIETSNPDDLAGGQTPLSPDQAAGRTRGTDCSQNTLSFERSPEVGASSQASPRGYTVSGIDGVSVKSVDRRTIEGSTPGDSRAHGAPAILPNNPGPREPKGQTYTENGKH
jgi:hypothetical protein